jgi:hypothetical protein
MRTHAQRKAALTRAKKAGGTAVVTECRKAVAEWQVVGWPDDWADWNRALWDAGALVQCDDLLP